MKASFTHLAPVVVLAALVISGCSQTATVPTSTQAPAAPAKAAAAPTKALTEPTNAAAAQPTAVSTSAKQVDFPAKGKAVTIIVPFSAGGGADVATRLLAPALEKELGTPVQIVNKPGASTQVGATELVRSKPDGYTLGLTPFASIFVTYLDPERKASYTRKDFQPVANFVSTENALFVKSDSPYKTLKDLVEAGKANPNKIKIGTSGILGNTHLTPLRLEEVSGGRFAYVHFGGNADVTAAVLGGHIDVGCGALDIIPLYRSGSLRILATTGMRQNSALPDVKTFQAQGYEVYNTYSIGLSAPAGTPKEIVDVLSTAIKKATENKDFRSKTAEAAMDADYMGPSEYDAYWTKYENEVRPLIERAKTTQQ
ncbi:MAG: tripartite tricarboxylate transporter substrate binding protein [Chloroflexi bacterium]|nr:tripartite tricarboxylate transporter substrate binding protein [Chloroflexota bacterium]